jgi:hypothetical protein
VIPAQAELLAYHCLHTSLLWSELSIAAALPCGLHALPHCPQRNVHMQAHGGGSIFGFANMLINATMTLEGAPKPAFWQGTLPISKPGDMSGKLVKGGWRVVEADGQNTLPADVFVATNRFRVVQGHEHDFEQRYAYALRWTLMFLWRP